MPKGLSVEWFPMNHGKQKGIRVVLFQGLQGIILGDNQGYLA
jgi:hypothetical protein